MTPKNSAYQKVTWSEIDRLMKILAEKINELHGDFNSISTISRGGLVPARLLADHLGIDTIVVDQKKYLRILFLLMIFMTLEVHSKKF